MSPPLDLENGQDEEGVGGKTQAKRGPGRPRKDETLGNLEKEMREQLDELAEWIRVRDPELAQTFLDDVPRMAKFLTARAGKHEKLARLLKVLFAQDGPLAGARAFGRTARAFLTRVNARRAEHADVDGYYVDEDGNRRGPDGQVIVPGA